MTCTNVRRMHGKVETPAKPRNGRIVIGVLLAALLVCVAIGVALHLRNVEIEQQTQVQLRDDFVAELERNEGTYDAQSIVLYQTSRAKAEELAEKLGASLRMTKDGSFATLTLPEGTTILDVCRDEENLAYIEQMSADYQVSISELIEGEEDEEGNDERLPMRPTYTVSDTEYDKQTYLDYMNMQNVWAKYTGKGITIAVIDTGIDTDHPEFAGRISEYSYNATEDKIVKDYVLENGEYDWSLVEDEQGHGTAVTGVIAASMNSGNVVGIAPNVTIITIKAECDERGAFKRTSDLVFGLYYAIERDVSVVNMSFGGARNDFAEATQLAYDSDIICVAAAGNEATSRLTYPAADPYVIGVGALAGGSWELADYSNYGENVSVVAPGTTYTSLMGGEYGSMDGTSLACPAVTGLLALYMQTHKYVMFDQVTEELYASCYDLGDLGRDWYFGFGAVDANAFLIEERGTVTYDMLTDEVDDIEGTFIRGHALQELPEPDRLYAIFDGWYYDEHCTQRVEYYTDAFYGDITLYANWANESDGIPYTYVILEDDTVEIRSYTGHRRFITIPEKIEGRVVSSIGDFAFAGETNLREVGLPSGLRHIGLSAFAGCSNLVSMYIPENVTEIEAGAFAECVRLSTIAFTGQSKLLTIGNEAFFACGKLRTIELPASLQSINGTAFIGTSELIAIRVQSGNPYFKSEDGVLFNNIGSVLIAYPAAHGTRYEIPENVRTVGDYAFYGAKVIYLELGQIQTIGFKAFEGAAVLTVNIPDSVTSMGENAFAGSAVRELTIGAGLNEIKAMAFSGCTSLYSVHIPEGIEIIHVGAFGFSGLQRVTFAENSCLQMIDDSAFVACNITEVTIPASVIMIGRADTLSREPKYYNYVNPLGAFELNPLESVVFEADSHLSVIGNKAFAYCSLGSIEFPNNIMWIGAGAFYSNPLKTVALPASLTKLGEAAFGFNPLWGVPQLMSITIAEGNPVYHDVDGVVYNLENTEIHAYPAGRGGQYAVLDTVCKVMPYSFSGTVYLEKVTLPEGLTEIGNYAFAYSRCYTYVLPSTLRYIKNGGFYCNVRLNSITLPEGLEQIAEYAFCGCSVLPTIHIPDSVLQIGRYAFADCWNLSTVTFNETAKLPRISFAAFAESGLESFRVPANVSTMAQYAFAGCYKLTSFTFAENSKLESISAYMFDGCSNLQTITFEQGSALTSVQAHGLEGMDKLTTINWGDAKVTNIDNFAFRFCESLAHLTLPDSVTNVGRYAFYGCTSLSELTLPASVEHIGSFAFLGTKDLNLHLTADTMPAYLDEDWDYGIRGYYVGVTNVVTDGDYKYAILTSGDVSIIEYLGSDTEIDLSVLDFGAPITAIGGSAFEDKDIVRITLPETLTSIQAEAFAYNPLEEMTIPAGVTFIGREAFTYTEIASLTFAEGSQIKTIEQYAFEKTENLTEVTLPASLTTMGRGVFQQSGLTSVTFEEGIALTKIPQNAFTQTKLTSITLPDSVNYVDHNAFREVSTLQSVTFGNAESISLQSNSFYHTGLTSLHIPANVTYIGEYSFVALANLTEITVDENNPWYKSEDGLLLSKDGRKLIVMPAGRTGSLTVPASVEMLGFGAFEETKLSEVKFDPNANILTLGYRAFFKANNITSIDIPKSVISIDYYAFAYCENLQTVNFAEDNQLKGIYEGAFCGDIRLENITIPDTIVEISDFAFYGCSKIDRIPISENGIVKGIYSYAFAYTGIAGEFTTPETLIDIGDYAFLGNKITKLTVPDTTQWDLVIGIGAFEDCYKLEEVTLPFIGASLDNRQYSWLGYIFGAGAYEANATYVPASLKTVTITEGQTLVDEGGLAYLTEIGVLNLPHSICVLYANSFLETTAKYELTNTIMTWTYFSEPYAEPGHFGYGLTGTLTLAGPGVLGNNTWSDGVTQIEAGALEYHTGLTSVIIPESMTRLEDRTFSGCTGLLSVSIPDSVTSIGRYAFSNCTSLTSVTIPDSVTSIGNSAFSGCTGLTSITIGNGVTTIGNSAFASCTGLVSVTIPSSVTDLGYAFNNCTELTSYIVQEGNPRYEAVDGILYEKQEKYILDVPSKVCGPITIPDYITRIEDYRFKNATELIGVTIPNSVTEIGYEAFYGCTNLTNVVIPASVTDIGSWAFASCTGLKDVYISNLEAWCNIDFPDSLANPLWYANILYLNGEPLTELEIPDGVAAIGDNAFINCTGITSVILPDSVTSIGNSAFSGCTGLINITIPDSVTSIGGGAFYDCSSLTSIILPDGLTSIEAGVFGNCTSLTSITIPDSVTIIDVGAFSDCNGLTAITIPDQVASVGHNAFWGCTNLRKVTLGNSVTLIDGYAFYDCVSLTSIAIPDSVTSIGDSAFANCTGLLRVDIGNNVTSIGDRAFFGCNVYYVNNRSNMCLSPGADDFGRVARYAKIVKNQDGSFTSPNDGVIYCVNEQGFLYGKVDEAYMLYAYIADTDSVVLPEYLEGNIYSLDHFKTTASHVTIPDNVTTIGQAAFYYCTTLISVTIPDSVTIIESFAFSGCSGLTSVTMPNSITSIGEHAFSDCTGLTSIVIPDSVRGIGRHAFSNCTSLAMVTIGNGVTTIQEYAFRGCSALASVSIPNSVTYIGQEAFHYCNLSSITVPNSVTYIGKDAFLGISQIVFVGDNQSFIAIDGVLYDYPVTKIIQVIDRDITNVNIPEGVREIGSGVFADCVSLVSVNIPDGVKTIGGEAFRDCTGLTSVTIPNSVTTIGYAAFSDCTGLTSVTIGDGVTSIGQFAFAWCTGLTNIAMGSGVTYIGYGAFQGCVGLIEVNIPDSVTSIESSAFEECTGLTNINIPDSVTYMGGSVFYNCVNLTSVILPKSLTGSLGYNMFSCCTGLTTVSIPNGVTSIESRAFYNCSELTSVVIPDSVISIGYDAFGNCKKLSSVTVPDSVLSIEGWAFAGCSELASVAIGNNVTSIGDNAFSGCTGLTSMIIPDSVTSIEYSAFYGCTGLTNVIIGNNVTSIGDDAFGWCTGLTNITIPDSVTSLGPSAFEGCTGLTSIILGNNVASIEDYVFSGCTKLADIVIPKSVTSIGERAFGGCTSLTHVAIPSSVTSIATEAFRDCTGLTSVTIPASVTSIGSNAFNSKTDVKLQADNPRYEAIDGVVYDTQLGEIVHASRNIKGAIIIPDYVISIKDYAFAECTTLTSVVIPDSVQSVGEYAFSGCAGLSSIMIGRGLTSINNGVFFRCANLASITVSKENPVYHSMDNCLIETATNTLVLGSSNSIIPDGVTSIGAYAFYGRSGLTSITIPDSVTSIGYCAFENCTGLTRVILGNSVESIEFWAFSGCTGLLYVDNQSDLQLTQISDEQGGITKYAKIVKNKDGSCIYPDDGERYFIDEYGFLYGERYGSYMLYAYVGDADNIILPDDIEGNPYGMYCFKTTARHVTIPNNALHIGSSSFQGCMGLISIVIPDSVTVIGDYAFSGCSNLTSVLLGVGVTDIYSSAFYGCSGLTNIAIPDSVTQLGLSGCTGLTSITIPDGVTQLNLSGCAGLTSITIPDGVTRLDLSGCTGLSSIAIPNSVKSLNLADCIGLTGVTLPEGIIDFSIKGCIGVTSIQIPDSVKSIDKNGFVGSGVYLNPQNWSSGCLVVDGWLIEVASNIRFIDTSLYRGAARGAYTDCHLLKNAIWNGSLYDDGATNVVTVVIKDITTAGVFNFPGNSSSWLPITVKNIIITNDVGLTELRQNPNIFCNLSSVTIYVEAIEKDLRWDANFPGWNNENRVVYSDNWITVDFYDASGNLSSSEPVQTHQIIRQPILQYDAGLKETQFFVGWDLNNDGVPDNLPATSVTDIVARPIIETKVSEYTISFYDIDGVTLIGKMTLPYGATIVPPAIDDKQGYTTDGWIGYSEDMTVSANHVFVLRRVHNDGGHDYDTPVWIAPTCEEQGYNKHICTICGEWYATDCVEAAGHDYTMTETPATCTEKGAIIYTCNVCGHYYTQTINLEGHDYVGTKTKEATCTEQGEILYTCRDCGHEVVEKTQLAAHAYQKHTISEWWLQTLLASNVNMFYGYDGDSTYYYECMDCKCVRTVSESKDVGGSAGVQSISCAHQLSDWIEFISPSCEDGVDARFCTICMKALEFRRGEAALGHDYSQSIIVPPTCTNKGYTDHICKCGDVYSDTYVNAVGHSYGGWYMTVEPTCLETGLQRHDCEICGYYETEVVSANGHTPADAVEENHIDSTCTEIGGYDMVVYCAVCGVELSRDHYDIAVLDHDMGEWYQTVAPTCTTEGENRRNCGSGCGYYETEVVPANGHTPADAVEENRFAPTCTEIGGYDMAVYCTVCGVELSREHYDVDALGHNMGEWYQTVAPTCTTEGENRRDCSRCDHYETEVVPANGHTPADAVEENRVDSTCTEIGGYDMAVYCTVCGVELSRDHYEIDALGHNMGERYQTVAPTCTTEGENKHDCSRCDYFETEVVSANGHTEADAVEENHVDPTCTEIGGYDMAVYCTVCEVELSREHVEIPANGHTPADAVEENHVDSTCTEIGGYDMVVYCTVCDAELSREHTVLDALGHAPADAVEENHINPTCTEIGGYDMVVYCTVCDAELSREHYDIEALGHAPATEWTEDLAPSCTAVGSKSHHCTRCDEKLDITEVPANGHSHTATVTAPTCIGKGFTSYYCHCTDFYIGDYVDALGHTEVIDEAVAPTCTATGLTEGKHCSVCNAVLVAQEVVPANGHSYESVVTNPTCTEKGYTTHTCHCGDSYVDSEIDALGHTPSDWIVDAEAQIGVEGSKHKECTTCGETLETEAIEALTEAPTTEPEPSGGCNGTISASVVLLALLSCFAVAWRPRKDN